ncbi:VanZ family protein [Nocardioides marmoraquaticus]
MRLARVAFGLVVGLTLYLFLTPAPPEGGPDGSDKVVHALLFAALAVLGRAAGWRPLPLGVGLVAYAALTEVLQASLPIGRDGDLVDLAADTVGTVLGLAVAALLSRARRAAPYPDRRRG